MTVQIIQDRLATYNATTFQDEELALKEIFQEIALAGLSRTHFFKRTAFQGGTALRILYGLDRFSENLDFTLQEADTSFAVEPYLTTLAEEFQAYGITMDVTDRSKVDDTIKKIFLKEDSQGRVLVLQHQPRDLRPKLIRIKLEIDTNPPGGGLFEAKYHDFPSAFAITTHTLSTLFAGKSHALLCRSYVKGRDWYDFLWYIARKTPINFDYLGQACYQQGPWEGTVFTCDKAWFLQVLEDKVRALDWDDARRDVERFVRPQELASLNLWSHHFFLDRLQKLKSYL